MKSTVASIQRGSEDLRLLQAADLAELQNNLGYPAFQTGYPHMNQGGGEGESSRSFETKSLSSSSTSSSPSSSESSLYNFKVTPL